MSFNKNILVLLMFCLLAFSCQKEVESISMETEFPETVELIAANLTGEVIDLEGNGVAGALIEILFDGEVLRSITTTDGSFSEVNQAYHPTHTVIKVTAPGFTPNFATPQVEAGQSLSINFSMDKHEEFTTHNQGEEAEHYNVNNMLAYFPPAAIETGASAYGVVSQTFDFGYQTTDLMQADRSIDPAGNLITLDFKEVFYLGVVNELEDELSVEPNQTFNVSLISDVTDPQVLYFDQKRGVWIHVAGIENTASGFNFSSDKLTMYGVVSACANDTQSPTPYCFVGADYSYDSGTELPADVIDAGSFDDCDTNLTRLIRRTSDDCGVGDDSFGPSLSLCPEDIGKNIEVEMMLIDDARNSDYCITNINIVAGGGTGDPIASCISLSTALVDGPVTLWAQDFNFQSSDSSTADEDLIFELKKEVDACGNGSDNFGPTIELCDVEKGTIIDITLRVTDEDNNSSTCTAELRII